MTAAKMIGDKILCDRTTAIAVKVTKKTNVCEKNMKLYKNSHNM